MVSLPDDTLLSGEGVPCGMVTYYAALSDRRIDDVMAEIGGKPFSEFKPMLAELAVDKLAPISGEMRRLMAGIDLFLCPSTARAGFPVSPEISYGPIPPDRSAWNGRFTWPRSCS